MLLHRTNSRRKSTPDVRCSSAPRFPQSGHDGWDQNDFRCIRVRTYLSDHFVRIGLVIVAHGHCAAVAGAAESWPVADVVSPAAVVGLWLVAVYVSAGFVLGSSPVALASVAQLAVSASQVSAAPALRALLAVPVSEVWLVPASQLA